MITGVSNRPLRLAADVGAERERVGGDEEREWERESVRGESEGWREER